MKLSCSNAVEQVVGSAKTWFSDWIAGQQRIRNRRLKVMTLEERRLPDASFALVGGVLSLSGFDAGDALSIAFDQNSGQYQFSLESGVWDSNDLGNGPFEFLGDSGTLGVNAVYLDGITINAAANPLAAVHDADSGFATGDLFILGGGDVRLDSANNDFDVVGITADTVVLADRDEILISQLVVSGSVQINATGSLGDTIGATIAVAGNATLSASGIQLGTDPTADVRLGSLTFTSSGLTEIREADDITLTGESSTLSLILRTDQNVLDEAGTTLRVSGIIELYADNIQLGDDASDITELNRVRFTATDHVSIHQSSTMRLLDGCSGSTVTLSSDGSIESAVLSSLVVVSATELTLEADGQIGSINGHLLIDVDTLNTNTGSSSSDQYLSVVGSVETGWMNAGNGIIRFSGGQFLVTDTITADLLQVAAGTILGGEGSIDASLLAEAGSAVSPGLSSGRLFASELSLATDSTFVADIRGTTAGTDYDQLVTSGTVTLAGILSVNLDPAFTAAAGTTFILIDNQSADAVSGTFRGLSEGELLTIDGQKFVISYVGGDGNDVVLSAGVPVYQFSQSAFTINEGDGGLTVARDVVLVRSGNTSIASYVEILVWSAAGDSAAPTEDFVAETFVAHFAVGQTTAEIPLQIVGDLIPEADETFTVTMTVFSHDGYADQNVTSTQITIRNDDTAVLVRVVNGSLIVTDETLSGADDNLLIRLDSSAGEIVIWSANGGMGTGDGLATDEVRVSAGLITAEIIFDLRGGDDVLTVDFSDGSPITGSGLVYHGGAENLSDGLAVTGNAISTAVYRPDVSQPGDGIISVDGQQILFTGLEPIDISGMAHVILQLPGADDLITISNDTDYFAGGINAALRVSGTSGGTAIETVALWNNALITIDTTDVDGTDLIVIAGADNSHNNQSLMINTGSGADRILIEGSIALDGDLLLQSAVILIDAPSIMTGASQSFSGAVEIAQSTSLTASSLHFSGTVDSASGEQNLLQIAGNTVFEQAVGSTDPLLGIAISGDHVVFQSSVNVGAAGLDLTVDSLTFAGSVTSSAGGSVSIANSGVLTIAATAPLTLDGSFQQTGAGAVQLAAGISTTGDAISFASVVTLAEDVLLNTTSGGVETGADINLLNINGDGFQLSLNGGSAGAVQANTLNNLTALLIQNSGNTDILGTLNAGILQINSTSGSVTVSGAITVGTLITSIQPYAVVLAGGGLVASSTVFLNTGGVTLGNSDDDAIAFIGGLTSTASTTGLQGTIATNGADITLGTTILNGNVRITTGSNGGDVVAGQISGAGIPLELHTGTGSVRLTDSANVIGDLIVTGAQVSITEADSITQASAWTTTGPTTLNAQSHDIVLTLSGNEFGVLNAQGQNISLVESADMDLGLVAAVENVLLQSSGSIRDTNGELLNVTSVNGMVRLQAGQHIGIVGASVLTTTAVDAIEVAAGDLQIAAASDAAVLVTTSARISELTGETVFLTGTADLDLSGSAVAVRNLSLLALNGTITLPELLVVNGDLRLEAGDVDAAGLLRIAAQRTLFKSMQSEILELNALLRNTSGVPGDAGTDSGQLDAQINGDLRLNSIGPLLELADLDGDGTAVNVGGNLFSVQAVGNVTQVISADPQQNSRIAAGQLELLGAADFDLSNSANDVDVLAADTAGSLIYIDADTLTIGTVGITAGVTTTNDIHIRSVGDLRIINSVIAADGIEDLTEAVGETIRLESVDGNITIDSTGGSVIISTDENPLQSAPLTGDRIILSADSDQSWTGNPDIVPPDQIPEGRITILGDVTISTDGGVARRFGPRPIPGASGTAFFVFVSRPLPVVVDNAALGGNGSGAFLNAFAVEAGIAGEQNLEVRIDWLDPVDEFGILNDAAIQAIAAEFGITNAVSSQRLQQFLVAEGGQLNLVGHVYTILDYTLFQTQQDRTTIPVVFSVSHHSSLQLDGVFIEQAGFLQSVPGRDLASTDNALTPPPAFENGYTEFNIPTLTPAPPGFFRSASVSRTDVVDVVVPPENRIIPDQRLIGDPGIGAVGGSVFSTKVFLQIRRQFEVDGPSEIVIDRITDSRLISSRSAFERFVLNNPELQDGSGYEIWLITETRGQTVERPIVEFEITGGRPGPAQDLQSDEPAVPKLQDLPFEQPADPAREIFVEPARGAEPDIPQQSQTRLDADRMLRQQIAVPKFAADGEVELPVSDAPILESSVISPTEPADENGSVVAEAASVMLVRSAVSRFRRAVQNTESDRDIRSSLSPSGRFRRRQYHVSAPMAGER